MRSRAALKRRGARGVAAPALRRTPLNALDQMDCTALCSGFLLVLAGLPASGQGPGTALRDTTPAGQLSQVAPPRGAWVPLGSEVEDRMRTAQLQGVAVPGDFLIRSPSSLPSSQTSGSRVIVLDPVVRVVGNSTIPSFGSDGGVWAGRGFTFDVVAGVRFAAGPLRVIVAPRVAYVQNSRFGFPSVAAVDSSAYRPRWRRGQLSADLPIRFGPESYREFGLGQSSVSVRAGSVAFGAATESQWWGPGIRNAIVLSNNAPGFPHLFARTERPWRTRLGSVAARWTIGGLTESPYFDAREDNDLRSHSAFALTFSPAREPGLTLGMARAVYATVGGAGEVPAHAADVFLRWRPADAPIARDPAPQVFSAFGRWVLPAAGAEVYGEWAWHQLPGSVRQLLVATNRARGFTVGGQWLRPVGQERGTLRLQAEATQLEASPAYRAQADPAFYASPSVPQGYTHRGRSLGAAIGPAASSQWLAADWLRGARRAGLFLGRVRWDNDAYYFERREGDYISHDVSLLLGVRGARHTRLGSLGAELQRESRLNYLFENRTFITGGGDPLDVANYSLRLTLSPGD